MLPSVSNACVGVVPWRCGPRWKVSWGVCAFQERQYRGDVRHGGRDNGGDQTLIDDLDFYVGIDLAAEKHQACVVNRTGKVVGELAFEHSGAGLIDFIRSLEKLTGPMATRGGLFWKRQGDPSSSVFWSADTQSFRLIRSSLTGSVIVTLWLVEKTIDETPLYWATPFGRICRYSGDYSRRVRLLSTCASSPGLKMIGFKNHNRLINQLREQLHRYFPQLLQLSSAAEDARVWDLIEIAPVPATACKLTRGRIERVLKRHRIRRLTAEEVIAALRVPALKLAPGSAEAASEHALLLLPRLRLIRKQRLDIASRMEKLLEELTEPDAEINDHRPERPTDVAVLRSLPDIGRVVAATLLAEASQAIADRDYQALRSYAGVAPVTRQSGNKRIVVMRRGCNNRLRNAVYHWSRVATTCDERSRTHYAKLRAQGHSHGRALRTLADRWLTYSWLC